MTLQEKMSIASFSVGSLIALVCLFILPPLGEIANTAISIVSEFLILSGALLGVSATFDHKLRKFEARVMKMEGEKDETE